MDRIRTVRDKRYRYIRNFMFERPLLQSNRYKESTYPMLLLMRRLRAEGSLTSAQEALFAPRRPPEELYDLEADPFEIHNLSTSQDPEHQSALLRLRNLLEKWIEESNDQGRTAEPPDVVQFWDEQIRKYYSRTLKGK